MHMFSPFQTISLFSNAPGLVAHHCGDPVGEEIIENKFSWSGCELQFMHVSTKHESTLISGVDIAEHVCMPTLQAMLFWIFHHAGL